MTYNWKQVVFNMYFYSEKCEGMPLKEQYIVHVACNIVHSQTSLRPNNKSDQTISQTKQ